jgi:hypothetical protein
MGLARRVHPPVISQKEQLVNRGAATMLRIRRKCFYLSRSVTVQHIREAYRIFALVGSAKLLKSLARTLLLRRVS